MKKILCLFAVMLVLCGCSQEDVDLAFDVAEALLAETETDAEAAAPETEQETEETSAADPAQEEQPAVLPAVPPENTAPQTDPQTVAYGEYYYDVENVVLYLDTYGELPDNYITKNEARDLGWEGGSVENYQDGAAIGGDRFGNYEGLLPDGSWVECDIDTENENSRGAKRLVFNLEDGLYYFTDDHYESFVEVVVDENGEVIWE
ncbi:MAG: ribonuclease [Clostridia bacterium]|nr:ribonuclease [Clostridia bacterium]